MSDLMKLDNKNFVVMMNLFKQISPDMKNLMDYLISRHCLVMFNFAGSSVVIKDSITERYCMFYEEELSQLGFQGVLQRLKTTFKEET